MYRIMDLVTQDTNSSGTLQEIVAFAAHNNLPLFCKSPASCADLNYNLNLSPGDSQCNMGFVIINSTCTL